MKFNKNKIFEPRLKFDSHLNNNLQKIKKKEAYSYDKKYSIPDLTDFLINNTNAGRYFFSNIYYLSIFV